MGLFDFSSDMESSDIDIESTIRDRVRTESFPRASYRWAGG